MPRRKSAGTAVGSGSASSGVTSFFSTPEYLIIPPSVDHHTLLEQSRRGDLNSVKSLLQNNPSLSVNYGDGRFVYYGMTPLMWACDSGHVHIVNYLLSVPGIEINRVDEITGRTALHYAAIRNYKEICEVLLRHGADKNIKTSLGSDAEEMAIARGQIEAASAFK
ncbi:predicted protein [Naegleria gruberi]|uniref:Predicted protein n=1 Tax=Naegleria gruberi TaxID=5762 RepID=D2VAX8_NAEGR|nr:uncharacterized protein NAEGRDRAFT_66015 [Naegleria gruberi]EFC46026.1 predicted protein [Naegleria gruberi]|eukprot:XP_002678770.1 predicted protein [Naegleria gruberi strain NEG-M]